jgi:hypothetical protein
VASVGGLQATPGGGRLPGGNGPLLRRFPRLLRLILRGRWLAAGIVFLAPIIAVRIGEEGGTAKSGQGGQQRDGYRQGRRIGEGHEGHLGTRRIQG